MSIHSDTKYKKEQQEQRDKQPLLEYAAAARVEKRSLPCVPPNNCQVAWAYPCLNAHETELHATEQL
jgi:hypothetical protein